MRNAAARLRCGARTSHRRNVRIGFAMSRNASILDTKHTISQATKQTQIQLHVLDVLWMKRT